MEIIIPARMKLPLLARSALALLRSAKGLDEDTRKLLVHAAGVFFRSAGRSLKQARVPDEQES